MSDLEDKSPNIKKSPFAKPVEYARANGIPIVYRLNPDGKTYKVYLLKGEQEIELGNVYPVERTGDIYWCCDLGERPRFHTIRSQAASELVALYLYGGDAW
jgi:hypothetical protein